MNQYTDIKTTPLKFHKFFWKIWIPLQIILGAYNFASTVADMPAFDIYYGIDIFYFLISGILFGITFGGFFRWKKSALKSLFIQMAINIIYVIILLFIYINAMPDSLNLAFGSVAGTFIRCIPVGIYYYKRRALFVKGGYSRQQMQAMHADGYSTSFSGSFVQGSTQCVTPQPDGTTVNYCHNCGKQIINNPNFCIHCGAKLR